MGVLYEAERVTEENNQTQSYTKMLLTGILLLDEEMW